MLNRPFAASHSRGTKPPCWRVKVTLEQDKQWKLSFKIMYAFCLSNPSGTFALQHASFVPPERLASKGLFSARTWTSFCCVFLPEWNIDYTLASFIFFVYCGVKFCTIWTFPLTPFRYKVVCLKCCWKSFSESSFGNVSNTKRRQLGLRKR